MAARTRTLTLTISLTFSFTLTLTLTIALTITLTLTLTITLTTVAALRDSFSSFRFVSKSSKRCARVDFPPTGLYGQSFG